LYGIEKPKTAKSEKRGRHPAGDQVHILNTWAHIPEHTPTHIKHK
jgi:hypothetical protein